MPPNLGIKLIRYGSQCPSPSLQNACFSENEFARADSTIIAFDVMTPHKFNFNTSRKVIDNCIGF